MAAHSGKMSHAYRKQLWRDTIARVIKVRTSMAVQVERMVPDSDADVGCGYARSRAVCKYLGLHVYTVGSYAFI